MQLSAKAPYLVFIPLVLISSKKNLVSPVAAATGNANIIVPELKELYCKLFIISLF
jgi:hypothetical protein